MTELDLSTFAEVDFTTFKRKVKVAFGLDLEAYKRPQMERRLRATIEKCGARSFQQYYGMLEKDDGLLREFLDRVTINVSELFRNPDMFEVLQTRVLPELLKKRGTLTVWSAGCSYGAEAYTLAILLQELSPGRRHSILATDIDDRMLERAQKGVFQQSELRNVTGPRLRKYFVQTPEGSQAVPLLRDMLVLKKHDLLNDPFRSGFDLILCRNVVIYFTDEAKAGLYRRFYGSLVPGGCLFVGGTERIVDAADIGFQTSLHFFYTKPERH